MNKFLLALLSALLLSATAHADDKQAIVERNTLKFLSAETITAEASAKYLKSSVFNVGADSLSKDATIIHNRLQAADQDGRPFLFAFNEGSRIVGVASTYDDSNKDFFNKLAATKNVTCVKQKSRFYMLITCFNKSAKKETLNKFQKSFKYLMDNAG